MDTQLMHGVLHAADLIALLVGILAAWRFFLAVWQYLSSTHTMLEEWPMVAEARTAARVGVLPWAWLLVRCFWQ